MATYISPTVKTNTGLTAPKLHELYHNFGWTLQQIGDTYGVTRERVRQLMESWGIPRKTERTRHWEKATTIKEYFDTLRFHKGEPAWMLRALLIKSHGKPSCEHCSSNSNIHLHHKIYPAQKRGDVVFLCASCHQQLHRNGPG